MNPFEWKAFESADVHFALWWIFTLTASWFLAKEPSFMLGRLHSLFNFRIFLQAMRHKSNDAGVLTTGWSLIGIGALGLLLMDTSPVHDLFFILLPNELRILPIMIFLWTIGIWAAFVVWFWWIKLLAWVADFPESALWLKSSIFLVFHVWLPLLLGLALITRYGSPQWVLAAALLSGILVMITFGFRWIRLLRLAFEYTRDHLLLMIFYICTFEIIPVLVFALNIKHG